MRAAAGLTQRRLREVCATLRIAPKLPQCPCLRAVCSLYGRRSAVVPARCGDAYGIPRSCYQMEASLVSTVGGDDFEKPNVLYSLRSRHPLKFKQ